MLTSFLQNDVLLFLENPNFYIRKEAALSCCTIVSAIQNGSYPGYDGVILDEIINRLLSVCMAESGKYNCNFSLTDL